MKSAKNWFHEMFQSGERRRAARLKAPRLVAYYWDGGAPAPHNIRDISLTGFYLLTDARWYPGTLLTMTLQTTYKFEDGGRRYVAVRSMVVRVDVDGVGLAFAAQDSPTPGKELNIEGTLVNKRTLEEFLKRIEGSMLAAKMCRQVQRQFIHCGCKCRYPQQARGHDSPRFSGSEQSFCLERSYSPSRILKASLVAPRRQARWGFRRKS